MTSLHHHYITEHCDEASGSGGWATSTGTKQNKNAMKGIWRTLTLLDGGNTHPVNAARCPKTMAALQEISADVGEGRLEFAGFFHLGPSSTVAPHCASTNLRFLGTRLSIRLESKTQCFCT